MQKRYDRIETLKPLRKLTPITPLSSSDELLLELKKATEQETPKSNCDVNCRCVPCSTNNCTECEVERIGRLGFTEGSMEAFKAARAKYQPDWNK